MKNLDSVTQKTAGFLLKPAKILALAGIIAAIAVFFLAGWLYRFPERLVIEQARQKAGEIVALAVEVAARPARQIRNSLALMARNPELRKISSVSILREWRQRTQGDLSLLIDSYEPAIGLIYEQALSHANDIDYVLELPLATMRRLALIVGMPILKLDEIDPQTILATPSADSEDLKRMSAKAGFVHGQMLKLRRIFSDHAELYFSFALLPEKIFGFGRSALGDSAAVEDFFSAALNDEMFRAILLKGFDGEILAIAGDAAVEDLNSDRRDSRAINGGSIFFAGPVGYDIRRHHPLWWVAVPVRDARRNPLACLSAYVDAGFLCEAAEALAGVNRAKLMFVDRNGVVIGHADRQMVARQVNLGETMSAFVNEADRGFSSRFIRHEGRLLLQAGKSIRHDNVRHLPDWYVCYEQDLTDFVGQYEFLVTVSVILLAAMGMYVLSCCVVRLF